MLCYIDRLKRAFSYDVEAGEGGRRGEEAACVCVFRQVFQTHRTQPPSISRRALGFSLETSAQQCLMIADIAGYRVQFREEWRGQQSSRSTTLSFQQTASLHGRKRPARTPSS